MVMVSRERGYGWGEKGVGFFGGGGCMCGSKTAFVIWSALPVVRLGSAIVLRLTKGRVLTVFIYCLIGSVIESSVPLT